MKNKSKKQRQEQETIFKMIQIYCHHHHQKGELCQECNELYEYAQKRILLCPFMETKTFCSNCKVHCYQTDMRERIRVVMRYSGPRMLYHNPLMAISHVITSRKEKRTL